MNVILLLFTGITAVATTAGAIAAVAALMRQMRAERPRVDVTLGLAIEAPGMVERYPIIIAKATNRGQVAVMLELLTLDITSDPKRPSVGLRQLKGSPLPYELSARRSCEHHLLARDLATDFRIWGYTGKVGLAAVYRDETGTLYTSPTIILDVDQEYNPITNVRT